MDLVALAQAAQDRDRVVDRRLAHVDRLEAPLEGRILFDVLAVFVARRGAAHVQLAPGKHRLQHVGRVDGTFRRARAHDRVQLVDEEDDLAFARGDLLEYRLESLLELAAVLRPRKERTDAELDDTLVLEPFGHVALHDPLDRKSTRLNSSHVAISY